MHFILMTFSIMYMVAAVAILGYILFSLVKKQAHTNYQWMQLSLLLSSVVILAIDYWLYSTDAAFVCGFGNSFMTGWYYILFFATSFLIAWKFHVASRGLVEYALYK